MATKTPEQRANGRARLREQYDRVQRQWHYQMRDGTGTSYAGGTQGTGQTFDAWLRMHYPDYAEPVDDRR